MPLLDCQELANKFKSILQVDQSTMYSYFLDKSKPQYRLGGTASIFESFYKIFYSNGYNYDISGYSLIFFYPPDLSGIGLRTESVLSTHFRDFMTLALEITPVDTTFTGTEIPLGATSYKLPNYLSQGSDFSIVFIDTDDLRLYTYHNTWLRYIKDVIRGDVDPLEEYINNNEIDYLGSVYVIKYDADMTTPRLIGKSYGIYPNGINGKEVFGNRSQYQVSMINMSYSTMMYVEEPYINDSTGLFAEFNTKIGSLYVNN